MAYAALLRFDAITLMYGPVETPALLRRLQQTRGQTSMLRPAGVTWTPVPLVPHRDGTWTTYRSDPYTYLQYAREMRSFYAAHRREPMFPFMTKVSLWLLDQQDVAVSFASASCSVLVVAATFLVGAYAFSFWVGLGAAFAEAIEFDVVTWGVSGWRDDAFTLGLLLFALAALRYTRAPGARSAVLAGAAAGFACLVRITALSFVVPGFAWLLCSGALPWRARLRDLAAAVAVAVALVAPFLVNCWIAFGDPLYAINVHADVYRATEGQAIEASQTAREYLGAAWRSRPIGTLDTLILGLTSYPFGNKWQGFSPWLPHLGTLLSWTAVAGLVLFLASGPGRLLLLLLTTSLVPYALTWRLIADWRFTEHAYPFFLVAAFLPVQQLVLLAAARRAGAVRAGIAWRRMLNGGLVLTGLGAAVWVVVWLLPLAVVRESLQVEESATIVAGPRDVAFFVEGWSPPATLGNVTSRATVGTHAALRVPLPEARDYDLMIRMDPAPRPTDRASAGLPAVGLFVNGAPVGGIALTWNPERVGAYEIRVPASRVRAGFNRLTLVVRPSSGAHTAIRLWYLRVKAAGR